jgi:hypothetical protein
MSMERRYRAGQSVEDVCRACKADRIHTVIVVDGSGRPIRVACDYCRSEHNYRGGPALDRTNRPSSSPRSAAERIAPAQAAFPLVGDRERVAPTASIRLPPPPAAGASSRAEASNQGGAIRAEAGNEGGTGRAEANGEGGAADSTNTMSDNVEDLEMLLRRVIREEAGVTPVVPAPKWRGGTLVLRPGSPGLQEKTWPIETFFHKVVMLRNRLRTLEQQVNASELPDDVKVKLQAYISGCYGSLTSFNVLFADEGDQFKGSGGD